MLRPHLALATTLVLSSCCRAPAAPPASPPFEPSIDAEVARLFTHPYPEGEIPTSLRVYLMVDAYPAAVATLQ